MFILNAQKSVLYSMYTVDDNQQPCRIRYCYVDLLDLLKTEGWDYVEHWDYGKTIEICEKMKGKFFVCFSQAEPINENNEPALLITLSYYAKKIGTYYNTNYKYSHEFELSENLGCSNSSEHELKKNYLQDQNADIFILMSALPSLPIKSLFNFSKDNFSSQRITIRYDINRLIDDFSWVDIFTQELVLSLQEMVFSPKKMVKSLVIQGLNSVFSCPLEIDEAFNNIKLDYLHLDQTINFDDKVNLNVKTLRCKLYSPKSVMHLLASEYIETLWIDDIHYDYIDYIGMNSNKSIQTLILANSKPITDYLRLKFPFTKLLALKSCIINPPYATPFAFNNYMCEEAEDFDGGSICD